MTSSTVIVDSEREVEEGGGLNEFLFPRMVWCASISSLHSWCNSKRLLSCLKAKVQGSKLY